MRKKCALLVIACIAAAPFVASAQSTDITSLLAQIQMLQNLIASIQNSGYTQPATPSNTSAAASVCGKLSRALSKDMSGADVQALQSYLIAQGMLTGLPSGYFDAATEAAVQQWQRTYGLISSGSPETTGWGVVGPRTRALIQANCKPTLTCPPAPTPATICRGSWSKITDTNGCTTAWKCSVPLNSSTAKCPTIGIVCPAGKHDVVSSTCKHTCVND